MYVMCPLHVFFQCVCSFFFIVILFILFFSLSSCPSLMHSCTREHERTSASITGPLSPVDDKDNLNISSFRQTRGKTTVFRASIFADCLLSFARLLSIHTFPFPSSSPDQFIRFPQHVIQTLYFTIFEGWREK